MKQTMRRWRCSFSLAICVFATSATASSEVVKISDVSRSIFFRGGGATRGNASFNGGCYSKQVFDGDFENFAYCNLSGVTELVIPTTGLDPDTGDETGTAYFVTEIKVGHLGNAKYSLYYTTDEEPTDILSHGVDPRSWILVEGASQVLYAGTKTFEVNKPATAVKYVFDTFISWTPSLAEVEVWAMDPSMSSCLHPNVESVPWSFCTPATCTENGYEERFCPDCDVRFKRENGDVYPKLGHQFVATLVKPGTYSSYGEGFVSCSRCDDVHIVFDGDAVDLTMFGGVPTNGVVPYADLTVSSTGGWEGVIRPSCLMDGSWGDTWGTYWLSNGKGHDQWIQYSFGTTIELTKIEYSVLNQDQTVDFYKFDSKTGEETLLKSIVIVKDETEGAPGFQRKNILFSDESQIAPILVDAIRMRIGDVLDPETGEVMKEYIGVQYGSPYNTAVCEVHPWGTIAGAGVNPFRSVEEAKITAVSVAQRWPFSGLVDIDYTLATALDETKAVIGVSAFDEDHGSALAVTTLSGDGATESVAAGAHRITWNLAADHPGFHASALRINVSAIPAEQK